MTIRRKIEDELRDIELMQEAGWDLEKIRAAEINVQAMSIAEHLEDAVRTTTAEHWREESDKWAWTEAEYRKSLDSRISRFEASIAAKFRWLIFLVLLVLVVTVIGWIDR